MISDIILQTSDFKSAISLHTSAFVHPSALRLPTSVQTSSFIPQTSYFWPFLGTNTYEQKAQTPFRIDFNFSLFILDLQSRLLTLGKA